MIARILARLSVSRKLMLIYLLDLSAVIFISGILIHEKFIAIDFARKELAGNAYIAQTRGALLVTAQGALATPGDLRAHADAVDAAQTAWGQGMESRGDAAALSSALKADAPDAFDKGRALITRIGNQSNLILDPDLDSYYTMSVVLLRYPELLEIVSQISAELDPRGATARPLNAPFSNDAHTRYLILEGRLTAVAKGIDSDFGEAFAASDSPLREKLQPSRAALLTRIERFREASRAVMDARDRGAATQVLRDEESRLLGQLDTAWQSAGSELDRLLDVRIHGFFTRMWLHLGTTLFLLLMILTAVFYVARQISMPLRRLAGVAETVRRSGDHSLRAEWESGDEIGSLVVAFNGMLAQIDHQRQVQQELAATARAAQAQQQLLGLTPIPMVVTAIPGHEVLHANRQAQAWLGGRSTDPWATGLEQGVRARFFQQLADRDEVDEFEVCWRSGAETAWAVLSARRLVYQGQDAVLTAFTPISHLKTMEQRLELWAKVFEASSEGIMIVDARHRIVTVNTAFCRHTDYEAGEVIGELPDFLLERVGTASEEGEEHGGARSTRRFDEIWQAMDKRGSWHGEVAMRRRDDSTYPAWLVVSAVKDGANGVSHYICTALDITDRKASEERIQFLAHHDALTGLPNRLLFTERLRLAMQHAKRSGLKVAVMFIDLDRFKTINDSLGHHVGDALLRSVSRRLLEAVRAGDTVSRLGGDEFVVALSGVTGSEEVLSIIERRLIPMIRREHLVGGAELHVSCSIGISMYPDDSRDIDEMMRHADVAMYQAKAMGRDMVQFFTPELNERAHRRLRVESHLRHAIERDELRVHYQPRVSAQTGAMVGVEALLRWQSPELGAVPPSDFIPIAEESRLILPIGAWVIAEACRQQALWKKQGHGDVAVSINVSAVQLRDSELVATLAAAIQRSGVNAAAIELELTESTLMEAVEQTLGQLHALKRLGVKLSVDDFGTGYSSLNYLNRFPIDRLKIDRSFVKHLLDDPTDLAITHAIIGLGHTLGLQVVAEGVETEAVAAALRVAGCDELQGFLYAKALPPSELVSWLARSHEFMGKLTNA